MFAVNLSFEFGKLKASLLKGHYELLNSEF